MSESMVVVIDRRDLNVSVEHRALRMEYSDGRFQRVPLELIDRVVIHGSPAVRCDVWRALASRNIAVALLPGRGRGDVAWLGSGLTSFAHWRQMQHTAHRHGARRLSLGRWVVAQKIESQLAVLRRLVPGEQNVSAELVLALDSIESTHSNASLMGVEGRAAAAWYGILARRWDGKWGFEGRNRRPPRDPINALLSLGYTLVTEAIRQQVHAAGLDPSLGFLHEQAPAREALVLDLAEPLRPHVDLFVDGLLDDVLTPEDFTSSARDGCRLSKAARGRFYAAWETASRDWTGVTGSRAPVVDEVGGADARSSAPTYAQYSLNSVCLSWVRAFRERLRETEQEADDALTDETDLGAE